MDTSAQTQIPGTNGAMPPPAPDAPDPGASPTLQAQLDAAAASARRKAEATFAKQRAEIEAAARKAALVEAGIDADDDIDEVREQLRERRAVRQAAKADPDVEKRIKALEKRLAQAEAVSAEKDAALRRATRSSLSERAQATILRACGDRAYNARQIARLIADDIAIDDATGQIGVGVIKGDSVEWVDGYGGDDGIAKYVDEFLSRADNANLIKPTGAAGAGSSAPRGTAPVGAPTDLDAQRKMVEELKKKQAEGGPAADRYASAYVAQRRVLQQMEAATPRR
jgi:hypothetical protein